MARVTWSRWFAQVDQGSTLEGHLEYHLTQFLIKPASARNVSTSKPPATFRPVDARFLGHIHGLRPTAVNVEFTLVPTRGGIIELTTLLNVL